MAGHGAHCGGRALGPDDGLRARQDRRACPCERACVCGGDDAPRARHGGHRRARVPPPGRRTDADGLFRGGLGARIPRVLCRFVRASLERKGGGHVREAGLLCLPQSPCILPRERARGDGRRIRYVVLLTQTCASRFPATPRGRRCARMGAMSSCGPSTYVC